MASKLIVSMDGLVLREVPLLPGRITIGRRPSNGIQLDNRAVSGEHAAIIVILGDAFLEDLNSTNGTLLNGQTVQKKVLKDGDIIEIAKYKLKYLIEADSGALPVSNPSTAGTQEPAVPPPPPQGVILMLMGKHAGRETPLVKNLTTIGKPGVQVATITMRDQSYYITAIEGSVPHINGVPAKSVPYRLNNHDIIELAGIKMEFFLRHLT